MVNTIVHIFKVKVLKRDFRGVRVTKEIPKHRLGVIHLLVGLRLWLQWKIFSPKHIVYIISLA